MEQAIANNLAKWGRNYLMTNPSVDYMVAEAKDGSLAAQAALSILTRCGCRNINGAYGTVSMNRAVNAVSVTIDPPYRFSVQSLDTDNQVITKQYVVNKEFEIAVITVNSRDNTDLEKEFLE